MNYIDEYVWDKNINLIILIIFLDEENMSKSNNIINNNYIRFAINFQAFFSWTDPYLSFL